MGESKWEEVFNFYVCNAKDIPNPVREFRFHPKRKWRSDFAWPDQKLLVEIEGGTWNGGRHSRGKGFELDCEKYNEAACLGYTVLRFTSSQVRSAKCLEWIEKFFKER